MHDLEFWKHVKSILSQDGRAGLVVMVHAEGDGPNRPGAKMCVTAVGNLLGTVGGGPAEYELAEQAKQRLKSDDLKVVDLIEMGHDLSADRASGMICSGTQRFAVLILSARDLPVVRQICRHRGTGCIRIDADGLSFESSSVLQHAFCRVDADGWQYTESLGMTETVTLIGGGHVSLALTPLLVSVGMRVVVLDNRPDLPTMLSNQQAHERRVVNYQQLDDDVPAGPDSYVCIMTFGHQHDETVLAQLVNREFRYIGMMGSEAKIQTIFKHLENQGIARDRLNRVHAPIGVPIGSQTPEEIAISVAAEIVRVRNGA